jgi:hypothetical protein
MVTKRRLRKHQPVACGPVEAMIQSATLRPAPRLALHALVVLTFAIQPNFAVSAKCLLNEGIW